MPDTRESRRRRQRRQAALCFIPDLPRGVFWLFAALAVLCGLLVIPALVVLKQRFKEIEGGESDAAAEY